jgi:hypothetical protein
VFLDLHGAAEGALIRAAAPTQSLGRRRINSGLNTGIEGSMNKLLATGLALMLISLTSCGRSSAVEGTNVTADLERLNQIWEQAWLDKDAALVEKLTADEYVYIAPNGRMLDRQAILKIIRSPSYHLDKGTRTEVIVKPVGPDTAVVVHRSQGEGGLEGKSFKEDHRCTMLCVRRGGEWRVILEQCSLNNP